MFLVQVGDGYCWSPLMNFTTVGAPGDRAAYPIRWGVLADLGQTWNSSSTLAHLTANKPDIAVLIGDFCYADSWQPSGARDDQEDFETSYQVLGSSSLKSDKLVRPCTRYLKVLVKPHVTVCILSIQ